MPGQRRRALRHRNAGVHWTPWAWFLEDRAEIGGVRDPEPRASESPESGSSIENRGEGVGGGAGGSG